MFSLTRHDIQCHPLNFVDGKQGPLLRNLTSERAPLLHVSGERLRDLTNLSPTSFLEFCILLGTDASPRIPHIGPVNARKLIDKYGSIDAILTKEPKIAERIANMEEFREMVASARKVFGELPPIPEGVVLEQGVWDDGAVDRLMEKKHGVRFVEPDGQNIEDEEKFEVGHEVEPLARLP